MAGLGADRLGKARRGEGSQGAMKSTTQYNLFEMPERWGWLGDGGDGWVMTGPKQNEGARAQTGEGSMLSYAFKNGSITELCIVGVAARFFERGEEVTIGDLEEWDWLTRHDWDGNEVVDFECEGSVQGVVAEPCVGFRFTFTGESPYEGHSSGVEWEMEEVGVEVFDAQQDQIMEMARECREEIRSRTEGRLELISNVPDGRFVRFLILCQYQGFYDQRTREYDSMIEVMGRVDLSMVAKTVKQREHDDEQ